MTRRLAGIEAGGTKVIAVIGNDRGEIEAEFAVPTTTPAETLSSIVDFVRKHHAASPIEVIGIGCFGPIDMTLSSKTYGAITSTPKLAWRNFNIVDYFKIALALPIVFDTDVNAALLGEIAWGAAQGIKNALYFTIGTGIGAGAMVGGQLVHGVMHTEMGHTLIPHDRIRDPFKGVCSSHGDCFEGLASGPALKERWSVRSAMDLPPDHPAWILEAEYLSLAMANAILCFSPERILLGGGVMKQTQLLPHIHRRTVELLAGYIENKSITHIEQTIVLASSNAGPCGVLALASTEKSARTSTY